MVYEDDEIVDEVLDDIPQEGDDADDEIVDLSNEPVVAVDAEIEGKEGLL